MHWVIEHPGELGKVAEEFLAMTQGRTLFAFYGEMGVGKTTFIKALATLLGAEDEVTSPTFAIVNEYLTKNCKRLYHFDFYRVRDIAEVVDLGFEEYLYSGDLCFMEWPEMVESLLPEDVIACRFSLLPDGKRELKIEMK